MIHPVHAIYDEYDVTDVEQPEERPLKVVEGGGFEFLALFQEPFSYAKHNCLDGSLTSGFAPPKTTTFLTSPLTVVKYT